MYLEYAVCLCEQLLSLPKASASQNEWLYSVSKEPVPIEKIHLGRFMMVEKEAMEKKMKAAVASIM